MTGSDLQFDRAEFAEGEAPPAACGFCQQPLRYNYWSVDGKPACTRCKNEVEARGTQGSGLGRFARATIFGSLAGALGAAVWYGIRAATNLEIGLISIVVGFAVGAAVKAGCNGRGGPLYQALAIFLTYTAICSTYVPYIIQGVREQWAEAEKAGATDGAQSAEVAPPSEAAPPDGPMASPVVEAQPAAPGATAQEPVSLAGGLVAFALMSVFIMALAYAAPFLGGFENILGIAIIAFGLYEAWKLNRRETPRITGPHAVGRPSVAAAAPPSPDPPVGG